MHEGIQVFPHPSFVVLKQARLQARVDGRKLRKNVLVVEVDVVRVIQSQFVGLTALPELGAIARMSLRRPRVC